MSRGVICEVTPVVDTAIYASGDQLGALHTLTGVTANQGGLPVYLQAVTIIDSAKQKAAMDLLFFDDLPVVASVDNGAASVTTAEMIDKCIGHLTFAAGDYKDLALNSTGHIGNLWKFLKPAKSKDGSLYVLVVSRGTPTYGTAADLTFKYHFAWE